MRRASPGEALAPCPEPRARASARRSSWRTNSGAFSSAACTLTGSPVPPARSVATNSSCLLVPAARDLPIRAEADVDAEHRALYNEFGRTFLLGARVRRTVHAAAAGIRKAWAPRAPDACANPYNVVPDAVTRRSACASAEREGIYSAVAHLAVADFLLTSGRRAPSGMDRFWSRSG